MKKLFAEVLAVHPYEIERISDGIGCRTTLEEPKPVILRLDAINALKEVDIGTWAGDWGDFSEDENRPHYTRDGRWKRCPIVTISDHDYLITDVDTVTIKAWWFEVCS